MHSESIYAWQDVPEAIVVIAVLIICGGLGFMVYRDVNNTIRDKKNYLFMLKLCLV